MTTLNFPSTGLQDKTRAIALWMKAQIFKHSTEGQYVPNVGDFVVDPDQGFFIVTAVDYTTGESTLTEWSIPTKTDTDKEEDVLVSVGISPVAESYRAFLDTSVTPHVIAPSGRLHVYGSDIEYYKLFKGTDITSTGKVIGFVRDTNGNVLGENIPFEEVASAGTTTKAIKAPTPCYTTETMEDGERVTLAAYSKEGHLRSYTGLVVVNSGAARYLSAARRYVKSIAISSPWLSSSDPTVIEVPINAPFQTLPMTGVVSYSDGSTETMSLENSRMTLKGRESFVPSVTGMTYDLVLTYQLASDELSYEQSPTTDRILTQRYTAKTLAPDNAYSVKLFMYPVWSTSTGQYQLEYWLYNIDRQTFYNVTSHVELGTNSVGFDPSTYGTLQTVTVAVDLNKVDTKFKQFRHYQQFQVTLVAKGTENSTNWMVKFTSAQSGFGKDVTAKITQQNGVNAATLNIKQDATSKELWLQKLFYAIEPLYNDVTGTETMAPAPTHFRVVTNHNKYERTVDQWDQTFDIVNDLDQGAVLYIEWIYRTDSTDLQLGITGLPVHIQ